MLASSLFAIFYNISIMRYLRPIVVISGLLICFSATLRCEEPIRMTVCELKSNPAEYDHKLIEITGFVSHGFEDFGLFDPSCPSWPYVWLEYGGTKESGTVYCCGAAARSRPKELAVEGIEVPLTADEQFVAFDKLIHKLPDTVVRTTLVGRFFAGEKTRFPNGEVSWVGFGHMGCCSLLAIQQVISVDPHDREDLDYRSSADQPNIEKTGCGYQDFVSPWLCSDCVNAQRTADLQGSESAFDNPGQVATAALIQLAKLDEATVTNLKEKHRSQGRVIYELKEEEGKVIYMIVISKPYLLSFYAKDPTRVAWVVIGAYKSSCEKGNSVTRIK
jgi:hypothetical protein